MACAPPSRAPPPWPPRVPHPVAPQHHLLHVRGTVPVGPRFLTDAAASPQRPSRTRGRLVLLGLVLLASAVFGTTAWVLTHLASGIPPFVPVLFALAVVLAAVLAFLVGERLWGLWRSSRQGLRGSRLHGRLVAVLSLVTIVPAVVAFVLSAATLQAFSENYFLERVTESNLVARRLANGYFDAQAVQTGRKLEQLRADLIDVERLGGGPQGAPVYFRSWLYGQAILREFSGLTLIGPDGRILSSVSQLDDAPYALPPPAVLAAARGGTPAFNVLDAAALDTYYAVVPVPLAVGGAPETGILVAYRAEVPELSAQLLAVRAYRDETAAVRGRLAELRVAFAIGYGLLSVILLLGAVWIGLLVASSIVEPVKRLAVAAGLVSGGDLGSRVRLERRDDELGDLATAFNDMTERLSGQRDDLIMANEQSEQRRRFIETVLSGVPSGVLNVAADGRVVFGNPGAAAILGVDTARLRGRSLGEMAPELSPLIQRAAGTQGGEAKGQVELSRGGRTRIINVAVVPEDPERAAGAAIVTLDDITQLVGAQRNAAWGDVARRIAHEIKNPLTPIQLSAERIRRRYGKIIPEDDREVFDKCTSAIVRHVGDIGRMVNEFSAFARMPEPVIRPADLRDVAREAILSAGIAHPDVRYEARLPEGPVVAPCDARLIGQAVGNLLKNAGEALTEHAVAAPHVVVRVAHEGADAVIAVLDNGPGLPPDAHRLTEPYMTTREKGTGLGLAIVRKATEDHGGHFELTDAEGGGALARIVLPTMTEGAPDDREAPQDEPKRATEEA